MNSHLSEGFGGGPVLPARDIFHGAVTEKTPSIEKVCIAAIKCGASDIHLAPGKQPQVRLNGVIRGLDTTVLTKDMMQEIFRGMSDSNSQLELETNGQADYATTLTIAPNDERSFRINAVKSLKGIAMTLRLISSNIPEPSEIGLSQKILQKLEHCPSGLFLATGATGSGKSTTLASLVQWLAKNSSLKIVTVEQPIEYRFEHFNSTVIQREVPNHARTFADTLKTMLRQDPDVIMIGELREHEEIQMAIRAAETGHLVLSTLHTNSAADTVSRIVDVFQSDQQELIKSMLSRSLLGIISQELVAKANGEGRVLAYETLFNSPAIANLIRKGQVERIDSTIQTSSREGMHTFDSYLMQLFERNIVGEDAALSKARNPAEFAKELIKRRGATLS